MTEVTKVTDGAGVQHAVRDENAVHKTGSELIRGRKTFQSSTEGHGYILLRAGGLHRDDDTAAYSEGLLMIEDVYGNTSGLTGVVRSGSSLYSLLAVRRSVNGSDRTRELRVILAADGSSTLLFNGDIARGTAFAAAGMPSTHITDRALPADGSFINFGTEAAPSYVAPHSGWIHATIQDNAPTSSHSIILILMPPEGTSNLITSRCSYSSVNKTSGCVMPVTKGCRVQVTYTAGTLVTRLRFTRSSAEVA